MWPCCAPSLIKPERAKMRHGGITVTLLEGARHRAEPKKMPRDGGGTGTKWMRLAQDK